MFSSTICNIVVAEFTRDTGFSASNEKHASSTNVTSASVAVIQFSGVMPGVLIDTCLCFRRHVPGWLCGDSMLLASCSYFAQHLFVHQVEGNTSQRTPLSTATFRPYNQIVIVKVAWMSCNVSRPIRFLPVCCMAYSLATLAYSEHLVSCPCRSSAQWRLHLAVT